MIIMVPSGLKVYESQNSKMAIKKRLKLKKKKKPKSFIKPMLLLKRIKVMESPSFFNAHPCPKEQECL